MFKQIAKNTTLMGSGTLLSRIFGFIRDVLIASFFGTSAGLEAFLVAFRIPNIFRTIFAEGFSDSVATPVLSSYRKDKEKIIGIGQDLICVLSFFLLLFTLIGIIFAKYFVILVAPGFITQSYKFNLAVSFSQITFFYLFLIGLTSNFTSILYAYKKFFIPAISPVFLNLCFIGGILFFGRAFGVKVLVFSVLAGGVCQLLVSFFALYRQGFRLKFNLIKALGNSQIIKMFKLFVGRLFSSLIYHLSVLVDTIFSSLTFIVGQGALASIYYANRLIQFPFAIVILSLSRVVMVDLSFYHKEKDMNKFKELLVFSFQNVIFFVLPISLIFLFLPRGIINVIFGRGEFDLYSLNITASVLFFYSFGLLFFCGIKLMVNSFYALADTKTPAKSAGLALLVNVVLSGILIFPLGVGGVALGSSLAAIFNFFLLFHLLKEKIGAIPWQDTKIYFVKVLTLSLIHGLTSWVIWQIFSYNKYIKIAVVAGIGFVIFLLGGYFLKIKQVNLFWRWLLKKK
ncbi:MAG: murein biosynthesis integral membrane protein MurJ [Candidatus Omnitrophica bacterium]|nr:murein biosynthesis integral membrane protein MurJ [Candidatus Omnitrophota bacterium]MCF7893944.1 murein biosynthesis integral membrane protein MurJ [Candidatus Omnitrophota bacterium]